MPAVTYDFRRALGGRTHSTHWRLIGGRGIEFGRVLSAIIIIKKE